MVRPVWTGSVAFGLVSVPVALYAATDDKTVHFNQFQAGTSDRIRYKRVNERTGREVKFADIVRGHEVSKGEYVLVTDEELEAIDPGRSRTIDIDDFVDLAEIDQIYFQKTYYLAPQGDGALRAYALLYRAMADTGSAGIATFVMHGKQYLAAIRAAPAGVLALETMFFADEVRDPRDEIDDLPDTTGFRGRELTIAKQLIDSMTIEWRPENYRDDYRERVEDLIERKQRGEEIVTEAAPPEDSRVVDLMEALRRSAEAQRRRSADSRSTAGAPPKRRSGGRPAGRKAAGGGTSRTRSPGKAAPKPKSSPKRKAGLWPRLGNTADGRASVTPRARAQLLSAFTKSYAAMGPSN
jgi:DNA end-binding protein Ku